MGRMTACGPSLPSRLADGHGSFRGQSGPSTAHAWMYGNDQPGHWRSVLFLQCEADHKARPDSMAR
jgi:hypothetical protein